MLSHSFTVNALESFTLAILLLFVGKGLAQRVQWLRRYGIPDAVVGGLLCAALVCGLYYLGGWTLDFDLQARDMLLLYFFAALGLSTNLRDMGQGGRSLVVLMLLASAFMLLQNGLGMGMAALFGMEPRAGLMAGSVALTGGVGTTLAWAPHFVDKLGIAAATELGLATNMLGLVAACVVGGPVALYLMRRHRLRPSRQAELEVGVRHRDMKDIRIDYHGMLMALLWLNMALLLGQVLSALIARSGLTLPDFVGCLMAGIALRTLGGVAAPQGRALWQWRLMQPAVALVSDVCLGVFITMALMGLQLWTLQPFLLFLLLTMVLQIALAVAFAIWVVFPAMGRDYEAVVVSAGFGGIGLGSTATAVANMTAVTREFGGAPRAFIIVPLVCGFFIDIANALVIGALAG